MHELGRFIQNLMDQEGMTQADLARRSGLSRQHIHGMLKAEKLTRLPAGTTIDGATQSLPARHSRGLRPPSSVRDGDPCRRDSCGAGLQRTL